jgi:CHAD domain-containing protein
MFNGAPTPSALLRSQLAILGREMPGLLRGEADAIHDARVATRRVRAVIPLVDGWPRQADRDDFRALFKTLGRKLGRARDVDVRLTLLACLEERLPAAASSVAVVRGVERARRERRTKAVVRALERLGVRDGLPDVRFWSNGSWRQRIVDDLRSRAREAETAIDHAAGLYFRDRLHRARIALKKFRYAVEIADAAGVAPFAEPIAVLKKAQDILGEVHDREMIAGLLERHADDDGVRDRDLALVRDLLGAEARALHRRYLTRRPSLFAICRGVPRVASRRQLPSPLLVATAIAAASALFAPRSRVQPVRSGALANRRPA